MGEAKKLHSETHRNSTSVIVLNIKHYCNHTEKCDIWVMVLISPCNSQ